MSMPVRQQALNAWRLLAVIAGLALAIALLPATASAQDAGDENVHRLDADTNVGAAIEWSQQSFTAADDAVENVVLGRDDLFPDNLASGVVQGLFGAPLLLTPGDQLDGRVTAELERLDAQTVHILGGQQAISEDVEAELRAAGYVVQRRSGATRIETAIDVAGTYAAGATHAFLSRAFGSPGGDETQAWADAIAGGAWAASVQEPILLTEQARLTGNTRSYLEDSSVERVTILGGAQAVAPTVEAELVAMGLEVERVSGANRFATATAVAAERGFADAGDVAPGEPILLIEGQDDDAWASGFAAAAHGGLNNAPIVLSNQDALPPETEQWMQHDGSHGVVLVCGPYAHDSACDEAVEALGVAATPATTLALSPQDSTSAYGENHTVTATLSYPENQPPEQAETVRFEVFREYSDTPGAHQYVHAFEDEAQDGAAQATYVYGGPVEASDTIVACLLGEGDPAERDTGDVPAGSEPVCAEVTVDENDVTTDVGPRDDTSADQALHHWVAAT